MSDRKGTVSVYGPNATQERARAACEAIDAVGLAAQLAALGRESDVSKVLHGPPDDPPLPSQRLFVIALDGVVAVTWSTPPVNSLAVAARLLS